MQQHVRTHIHMAVGNLPDAVHFYTQLFGGEPVKTKHDYAKFLPDAVPLNLALSPGHPAAAAAQTHFGIEVQSSAEVERHRKRVTRAGLPVRIEQSVECCYANQDKFWVTDPDGRQWEIYHVNQDIEHRGDADADTDKPCCDTAVCCADVA